MLNIKVALFELLVWPHEVEPWFHSWYRDWVEALDVMSSRCECVGN